MYYSATVLPWIGRYVFNKPSDAEQQGFFYYLWGLHSLTRVVGCAAGTFFSKTEACGSNASYTPTLLKQ